MKDQTSKSDVSPSAPTAPAAAEPVVLSTAKKKKKKSSRFRHLQDAEAAFSKSGSKMAKAFKRGFDTWIEERDKSAEKRKDGAVREFPKNFSKAFREFQVAAAEAPADLIEGWADAKAVRKLFKV